MAVARYAGGAEWYQDRIVVIGGFGAHGAALNSVETYDLDYNRWKTAAPMPTARGDFGIDYQGLSQDIDVFGGADSRGRPLAAVETYNVGSNRWYHLTTMPQPRRGLAVAHGFSAGNMMIAGGISAGGKVLNSVLEFVAASRTWRTLPSMHTPRYDFALVDAQGGTRYPNLVYAIGGFGANHKPLRSVEAYNPAANRWIGEAPLPAARGGLAATCNYEGDVVTVAGGTDASGKPVSTVEQYSTTTNSWAVLPPMPAVRTGLSLVDTSQSAQPGLFAIGGRGSNGQALLSVDRRETPLPAGWSLDSPLPVKLAHVTGARASNGTIYAVSTDGTQQVEAFNPVSHTWSVRAPLPWSAPGVTAAAGTNGTIYVMNGWDYSDAASLSTFQRYNPATNTWTALPSMPVGRADSASVEGTDGKIYVLGGAKPDPSEGDNSLYPRGLAAFDPKNNSWQLRAPMPTARQGLGATAGLDGTIYAIGGETFHYERTRCFATVEAYNPRTNTWREAPPLTAPMCRVNAATGPDGTIYAISGTIESYKPGAKSWHVISQVPLQRSGAAAVLGTGRAIYVIGGECPDGDLTATVQRFSIP